MYEVMKLINDTLSNDTTLQGLLGGNSKSDVRIYPSNGVPLKEKFPCVTYFQNALGQDLSLDSSLEYPSIQVDVWSDIDIEETYEIYERVKKLLHKKQLESPSVFCHDLRLGMAFDNPDGKLYRRTCRFDITARSLV